MQVARARVVDCERLYGPDHLWTFDARRLVAVTVRRTGRVRVASPSAHGRPTTRLASTARTTP